MPQVLAETLRERHAAAPAALRAPVAHGPQILIDAVVFEKPSALTVMGGQHFLFPFDHSADVDGKARLDVSAQRVLALYRIAVIKMGNVLEGRRQVAVREEVAHRR